jgi:hypothetical protein
MYLGARKNRSLPVARGSLLFHGLGAERSKQRGWMFCLGRPVTDRVHVHVRASGSGSTGSPGSRLTWRALRGIALCFSALLSGRHSDLVLTKRWATCSGRRASRHAKDRAHDEDVRRGASVVVAGRARCLRLGASRFSCLAGQGKDGRRI